MVVSPRRSRRTPRTHHRSRRAHTAPQYVPALAAAAFAILPTDARNAIRTRLRAPAAAAPWTNPRENPVIAKHDPEHCSSPRETLVTARRYRTPPPPPSPSSLLSPRLSIIRRRPPPSSALALDRSGVASSASRTVSLLRIQLSPLRVVVLRVRPRRLLRVRLRLRGRHSSSVA
ncbi:hypothetical protein ACSQ67_020843 [Phaseolus vulgaris]